MQKLALQVIRITNGFIMEISSELRVIGFLYQCFPASSFYRILSSDSDLREAIEARFEKLEKPAKKSLCSSLLS
jgi:hypothetical protein